MEKALTVLRLLLSLLPLLVEAVKAIEAVFPQAKAGEQKASMLRLMLENAYTAMETTTVAFEELWPKLKTMADATVALYNATGVFKKD